MYRPGGIPELVAACVLLSIATGLGSFALYASQVEGEGGSRIGPQLGALVLGAGAILSGWFGGEMLLGIESKQLSRRVAVGGLVLGLLPYALVLGRPGYAFNAAFLVAALASLLAIFLRRSAT